MRKKNWLLSKFLVYLAFIAINLSCEKDLYDDPVYKPEKSTIKEVKFDELFKDSKFKSLLQSVSNNSNMARSAFENQNGFTISNTNVKVIQTDSVTSYTMLIQRDSVFNSSYFENLVIQEDIFNNQKAFIIKYTPNQINSTVDNSFAFQGEIRKSQIAFTGFNRNSSYQNTTQADCYIEVLMCSYGEDHVAGQGCVDKPNPTLYLKKIAVLCQDNGGGSGGSGDISIGDPFNGGGGSSGSDGDDLGDPFSGGSSSGGSGTGSTGTNNDGFDSEVVTSPVITTNFKKTPCQQLALMTMNFALKNVLTDLETKTGETKEFGYKITKTNLTFDNPSPNNANPYNPNQIVMRAGENNIGCFHIHPNPVTTGIYPMFSPEDIEYLLDVARYHNNNGQPKDFSEYFITLTVDGGTFALKIKDFLNFRSQMAINYKGKGGIKEKLEKEHYDFREPSGDINLLKKDFLTVTRHLGIGLYEASSDLSSWSEVVLDLNPMSPTFSEPKNIPCN